MRGQSQSKKAAPEPIGKRVARLRAERGWTQQSLAARLAISRVAISHIEMGLSTPDERTITLMAGAFKLPPHELVGDTTYPRAKADKLPQIVSFYTPLEMELALFENDLAWLERLAHAPEGKRLAEEVLRDWVSRLERLARGCFDSRERERITSAQVKLKGLPGFK